MGSLKNTHTTAYRSSIETIALNCLVYEKITLFCVLALRSNMVDLCHLNFRGPVMGSLKSPCTTSYKLSIDTIALNCLVYEIRT